MLLALLALSVSAALGLVAYLLLAGDEPASRKAAGADQGSRAATETPAPPRDARLTAQAPPREAGVALETVDAFRLRFKNAPRAGLVFDLRSGDVLWRRRPLERLPVASLTKIMTALLVTERTGARERVRIAKAALDYSGSGVGRLPKGRHVPIEALLHGLLLVSGNDAAKALAIHVARSEPRFVRLMNHRARGLGLNCTRFHSSHGLDPGDRSCAADLAALARLSMSQYRIARVVRKQKAVLRFPIKRGRLHLNTTNPLLRTGYRGTIGLKTGYTRVAGRCLVAVARRGRRTLGVVLLHSPDPARQARKLLNTAFRAPR